MRARSLFALLSLTTLVASLAACSPQAPTDGFYGCATGACPAAFPYCDPVDLRCHANVPQDSGPRPDAPGLDAFTPVSAREYTACGTPPNCPASLACIGGSCMTACGGGGTCTDARNCRPVSMTDTTMACVVSCTGGGTCPSGTRMRTVMGGECQCAPMTWP